jgi:uncharacterized membrane protein
MTEQAYARLAARGLEPNVLQTSGMRIAGQDFVPLSNPDILTARAILNISDGPLRLDARVPDGVAYWSLSVFAADTDVAFLDSDRTGGRDRMYVFTQTGEEAPEVAGATVVELADTRSYALVRVTPQDPADAAQMAALQAALATYDLSAVDTAEAAR